MVTLGCTLIVFAISFSLSVAWAHFSYWTARRCEFISAHSQLALLPALVISPLFIIAGFSVFQVSVIFPALSSLSWLGMTLYSVLPAVVLFFASGLFFEIVRQIQTDFRQTSERPYYLFSRALGQRTDSIVRPIIILKALSESWQRCLPWFFGELVVVEAMFNAPGLGYRMWMYARIQDLSSLTWTVAALVAVYVVVAVAISLLNRWMGGKLEGYS